MLLLMRPIALGFIIAPSMSLSVAKLKDSEKASLVWLLPKVHHFVLYEFTPLNRALLATRLLSYTPRLNMDPYTRQTASESAAMTASILFYWVSIFVLISSFHSIDLISAESGSQR